MDLPVRYGEFATMSIQDDQQIYEYLGRVADAAQGRLAPLDRVQLVEDVRVRIESIRAEGTPVSRILAELGSPEVLVARSVRQGQMPAPTVHVPLDETLAMPGEPQSAGPPPQADLPAYTGLVVPEVRPADGAEVSSGPGWLGGRLRPSRSPTPGSPIGIVRGRYLLEIATLLAYTVGTFLISYIGFLVGVAFTLMSKVWNEREKGVAIALVPALTLGVGVFVVWVSHDRSGSTQQRFDRAMSSLGDFFSYWPRVAGVLAAVYLFVKLVFSDQGAAGK